MSLIQINENDNSEDDDGDKLKDMSEGFKAHITDMKDYLKDLQLLNNKPVELPKEISNEEEPSRSNNQESDEEDKLEKNDTVGSLSGPKLKTSPTVSKSSERTLKKQGTTSPKEDRNNQDTYSEPGLERILTSGTQNDKDEDNDEDFSDHFEGTQEQGTSPRRKQLGSRITTNSKDFSNQKESLKAKNSGISGYSSNLSSIVSFDERKEGIGTSRGTGLESSNNNNSILNALASKTEILGENLKKLEKLIQEQKTNEGKNSNAALEEENLQEHARETAEKKLEQLTDVNSHYVKGLFYDIFGKNPMMNEFAGYKKKLKEKEKAIKVKQMCLAGEKIQYYKMLLEEYKPKIRYYEETFFKTFSQIEQCLAFGEVLTSGVISDELMGEMFDPELNCNIEMFEALNFESSYLMIFDDRLEIKKYINSETPDIKIEVSHLQECMEFSLKLQPDVKHASSSQIAFLLIFSPPQDDKETFLIIWPSSYHDIEKWTYICLMLNIKRKVPVIPRNSFYFFNNLDFLSEIGTFLYKTIKANYKRDIQVFNILVESRKLKHLKLYYTKPAVYQLSQTTRNISDYILLTNTPEALPNPLAKDDKLDSLRSSVIGQMSSARVGREKPQTKHFGKTLENSETSLRSIQIVDLMKRAKFELTNKIPHFENKRRDENRINKEELEEKINEEKDKILAEIEAKKPVCSSSSIQTDDVQILTKEQEVYLSKKKGREFQMKSISGKKKDPHGSNPEMTVTHAVNQLAVGFLLMKYGANRFVTLKLVTYDQEATTLEIRDSRKLAVIEEKILLTNISSIVGEKESTTQKKGGKKGSGEVQDLRRTDSMFTIETKDQKSHMFGASTLEQKNKFLKCIELIRMQNSM